MRLSAARVVGGAHRPSQEGRHRQGGRASTRRLRLVDVASVPADQDGEARPLPDLLSDDEQQDVAAGEDRPQLDAAE